MVLSGDVKALSCIFLVYAGDRARLGPNGEGVCLNGDVPIAFSLVVAPL